jgi:hypothetical protein
LNLFADLIRARAEDHDHFVDFRLSEIVEDVLQQGLLAEKDELLEATETRGLAGGENNGGDHCLRMKGKAGKVGKAGKLWRWTRGDPSSLRAESCESFYACGERSVKVGFP